VQGLHAPYVAILQAQGGVCYICYEPPRGQRLSIDHDHALPEGRTAVRGLLCRDCNYSRLPRFEEEDVAMLQRAISYLTAPPARSVIAEGTYLGVSVCPTGLGLSATGEDDGAA
jgi:Recombination endonuclease VII